MIALIIGGAWVALVLVMVNGEPYVMTDIGMRMLIARELFLCQGFPPEYIIAPIVDRLVGKKKPRIKRGPLTAEWQVSMCGNSVPPQFVKALAEANADALYGETPERMEA